MAGGLRITEKEERLKIREAKAQRNEQMYEEPERGGAEGR